MLPQIPPNQPRRNPQRKRPADTLPRQHAHRELGEAEAEVGEEGEDGELEGGRGVGVEAVVCFQDDEAFVRV